MEVAVVVVLFCGAVLSYARRGRSRRPNALQRRARTKSQSRSFHRSGRFDVRSAEPERRDKHIVGRAYVVDGDTLVIRNTQIRLYGIDAPELDHPYGKKAKWALFGLCKGQTIKAQVLAEDDYGRTVARCFLPDGRDLSAEMVKMGLAIDWAKFSGGEFRSLECDGVRKGLWLADARQKGRMHVWERYSSSKATRPEND